MRNWVRNHPLWCFCVVSMAWICILCSSLFSAPFVYDDLDQVANNPALNSWHTVWTQYLLMPAKLGSGFLHAGAGQTYRPVFWIALALEKHLFGSEAAAFHLTGLLLHWINGVLLFLLLRWLRMRSPVAALATLIWLGMPVNSEAVAWISGQLYLLSTGFLLLALLLALSYLRSARRWQLAAFTVAALLADLSHEQGILLLGFLALGYCFLEEEKRLQRWAALATLALLADAMYFACRWAVGVHSGAGPGQPRNVGEVFWYYLRLIFLPVHMSVERSTDVPSGPAAAAVIAWIMLIAVVVAILLLRRRSPTLAAAASIVLVAVLPYCGFVYIYQGMAERYVYLASIGVAVGVTAAAAAIPARETRAAVFACLAVWIGWASWRWIERAQDWQNPMALYGHSLDATPQSALMNLNYGAMLQAAGRQAEAESRYRRVISLAPVDSAAYLDLESLYIEEDRPADAIAMYKQVIALNPKDAAAYFDLGVMFQQRGQDRVALALYKKVLQLKPNDPQTLLYLGKLQLAASEP